jgi:hypothetical protein
MALHVSYLLTFHQTVAFFYRTVVERSEDGRRTVVEQS